MQRCTTEVYRDRFSILDQTLSIMVSNRLALGSAALELWYLIKESYQMQSESIFVCVCVCVCVCVGARARARKNVHRLETIAVTNLVVVTLGSCKEITKTLEDAVN